MPIEGRALDLVPGSLSNAYVPDIRGFLQSESSAEPQMQVVLPAKQSLGASGDSRISADKLIQVFRDLSESVTFVCDPALTTGFLSRELPVVVGSGVSQFEQAAVEDVRASEIRHLCRRVFDAIRDEAVEDGYLHPAETLLSDALGRDGDKVREYMAGAILAQQLEGPVISGVLRLLGRQGRMRIPSDWFVDLARTVLSSEDVEVRDSVVQAIELLEDENAVALLSEHVEPCGWLAEYIADVVRDLKG